ncbi:uncharacterized protein LOC133326587, partial [Musca vetustissima]|uniref:uncharacterized protein LOC133326587 n=1 Tax=Musca vetustissima TaxID=27455 RepID=UPI002AB6BDA2
ITLICGLVGQVALKPLEESSNTNDATDALIEIEKQRLIKFPEELDDFRRLGGQNTSKTDEAKRILEEIEKINQALGYVKKSDHSRTPAILDSSQYLFPNTGYQPFHAQNPQVTGSHGETLLLPSIRAVKFDGQHEHKASEYNKPPVRKSNQKTKVENTKANFTNKNQNSKIEITKANLTKLNENTTAKPTTKPLTKPNKLYFHPHRVEVPKPQTAEEKKLLPTHFVIPVRLYKNNKQQYIQKHNPQEYKIKGYKIVGDIDHFYGKTKTSASSSSAHVQKVKSSPKYHLLFLPQEVMAKNNGGNSIEAMDANSTETSSREEKLANRPFKLQTNTQTTSSGNFVNASSSATIIRKRIKPIKGEGQSVLSVTSASVIKVTPAPNTVQHNQQQHQQQQLQQTQIAQPPQQAQQQLQQTQYQKPGNGRPNNQPLAVSSPVYLSNQPATAPTGNADNNQGVDNNGNQNSMKNRPAFVNPLLGLQSNIQNNINNINNATSNAIKTAFQNIFRLPFRPDNNNKPQQAVTDFPLLQSTALQMPPASQQQQQQFYYTLVPAPTGNGRPPVFIAQPTYQSDHMDSDYKWDDENISTDSDASDDKESTPSSEEPVEEKFLGQHQPIKHMQETQKEALKQGGIIIQKLKVRKGSIAIAGPGGVATAGSGGTAIVGPGGYALTHPRSLTIAGPGTKVIAIPANVDLKDALQRTDIKTKMIPREGRIVATGPTVYYAPGTMDGVEIE